MDPWAEGFDWPAQEAALSRHPRYRVQVGRLGVQVVHARAARRPGAAAPLPLVLCHGWPDSAWRYGKGCTPGATAGWASTPEEVLTNVTTYWLPAAQHVRRLRVPTGYSHFPADTLRPSRARLMRTADDVRVSGSASAHAYRMLNGGISM